MTQLLPAPDNDSEDQANGSQCRGGRRRQRRQIPIPGVDRILEMLLQLNSAVTVGMIAAKEGALIHRNLRTILEVQLKRGGRANSGPSYDALVELCRRDPKAIDVLESFLTDEAFDLVMKGATESSGESA